MELLGTYIPHFDVRGWNVRERETGNATNLVDGVEDTKLGALRVAKVLLPGIHDLG